MSKNSETEPLNRDWALEDQDGLKPKSDQLQVRVEPDQEKIGRLYQNGSSNSSEKNRKGEKDRKRVNFWSLKSIRLQIGILLCLNFFVLAVMRNNLGIAIVCMVNRTAVEMEEQERLNESGITFNATLKKEEINRRARSEGCPLPENFKNEYSGEFTWTSSQQGMLFAAVYWGSFSTLLAGWLSDRYSARLVLLASGILNVLSTVLTPLAAKNGGYTVMFLMRCFAGIGQGLQRPATNAMLARWMPPDERSTVVSLYTTGNQLSSIISTPLFAWLCRLRHVIGGWPLIFYTSAGLGVIWCLLWFFLATNEPSDCRRIGKTELEYIEAKLQKKADAKRKDATKSIPWRKLLTSLPVIACVLCSVSNGMVLSIAGSYVPTYFMTVLYMDLQSNGLFGALPFIVQWAMKFVSAALADNLLRRRHYNPTIMSKVFNSIASVGTGGFLFGCTFLTCDQKPFAITFLCLSFGFFGVFASGYWTSMVNIAPVYAGTICSLATTALTIGAIVAPYLVGGIVVEGHREEWQLVFGIIAAVMMVSGVFYVFFSSAEIQPWARLDIDQDQENCDSKQNPAHWKSQDVLVVQDKGIGKYLGRLTSEERTLARL